MGRDALTIREMGEQVCWTLVQQAMGIPDAKMPSNYLENKVALLLFAKDSLPERLCVTAAVRQMSGTTIYQGGQQAPWRAEVNSFQAHLFPLLGYFLDCLFIYGVSLSDLRKHGPIAEFPIINAGSPEAHPVHALADIACMLRVAKDLHGLPTAWVGCPNGTLHSLIEATSWFPFEISVSVPPECDISGLKQRARELGTIIRFTDSPEAAVADAEFIFAGKRPDAISPANQAWAITPELMARASQDAHLLLSATPIRAIPVAQEVLSGKRAMLVRQAEYRLCVHKRILHWVFQPVRY